MDVCWVQDEIDLEFLGDKPDVIQTNFYVDEVVSSFQPI